MPARRGHIPWNKGTKGLMRPNQTSWPRGHRPWNAGTRGVMKPNRGSFGGPIHPGGSPVAPLGARRWRGGKSNEVFVKTSISPPPHQPSRDSVSEQWTPLRIVSWEAVHGPVPRGGIIRRLTPLCDCEPNLVLIDRATNAALNSGKWCRPPRPWRTLPPDADVRLTAVLAAIAATRPRQLREVCA